jgi:tetratricopeptide (TPR) repeat protein
MKRHESGVRLVLPAEAAHAALAEGESLLKQGALEDALGHLESAARVFQRLRDAASTARALLGLGQVLLGLEDPRCREVLEDAGTLLEDLGDEPGVLRVDRLLRIAESSIAVESPRSFHASIRHRG